MELILRIKTVAQSLVFFIFLINFACKKREKGTKKREKGTVLF